MLHYKLYLSLFLCWGISGCENTHEDIAHTIADIRQQKVPSITPVPTFAPVPSFQYVATQLRSPFIASSLATELKSRVVKKVQPKINRIMQPLEYYELQALKMKGSFGVENQAVVAFIQTPEGMIHQVKVGDYLGENQGRITKISPTAIELAELISDGKSGYIERLRTLDLMSHNTYLNQEK